MRRGDGPKGQKGSGKRDVRKATLAALPCSLEPVGRTGRAQHRGYGTSSHVISSPTLLGRAMATIDDDWPDVWYEYKFSILFGKAKKLPNAPSTYVS